MLWGAGTLVRPPSAAAAASATSMSASATGSTSSSPTSARITCSEDEHALVAYSCGGGRRHRDRSCKWAHRRRLPQLVLRPLALRRARPVQRGGRVRSHRRQLQPQHLCGDDEQERGRAERRRAWRRRAWRR